MVARSRLDGTYLLSLKNNADSNSSGIECCTSWIIDNNRYLWIQNGDPE